MNKKNGATSSIFHLGYTQKKGAQIAMECPTEQRWGFGDLWQSCLSHPPLPFPNATVQYIIYLGLHTKDGHMNALIEISEMTSSYILYKDTPEIMLIT